MALSLSKEFERLFGNDHSNIDINKTYTVYSLIIGKDCMTKYSINNTLYRTISSKYFDIIDSRLSKYWHIAINTDKYRQWMLQLGPDKWVNSDHFAMKYVDGDYQAREIIDQYVKKMDLEFAFSKDLKELQEIENYYICPNCSEAWQDTTWHEVTECPKCMTKYLRKK